MMRIMSKTKVLLIALVMVVFMVASATMASAAVELGTVSMDYTGTTQEAAIQTLRDAMAKVEEGNNVTLTLKADMVFDAEQRDFNTIGTDTVSAGTLYIVSELDSDGAPKYGISVGTNSSLHFMGNVAFDDIRLERDVNDGVSYYTGSYIFVTEGTGTFGDPSDTETYGNITNPDYTKREGKISLAGDDLKIYSGYYMTVAANFNGSQMDVDSPSIVFGGKANAEHVAGRGAYTGAGHKVTGDSMLTLQDDAYVSSILTAGHLYPAAKEDSDLGGDATLNMNGGRAKNLYYLGYSINGGTQGLNYNVDAKNTRSEYKINLTGGEIVDYSYLYALHGKVANIKYVNVVLDVGATTISDYMYGGVYVTGKVGGMEFSDCKVTFNFDGATLSTGFFGGSYISTSNETAGESVVDNIERAINITNTSFVSGTKNCLICFGSRMESTSGIVASEHKGKTTIEIYDTNGPVNLGSGGFYGGSYLAAQNAKHTGDIKVTATSTAIDGIDPNGTTRYMGAYIKSSNTEFSSCIVTANWSLSGHNMYISNKTIPSFALCNVSAGLEGVVLGGESEITLENIHMSRTAIGGSVINSPVKNTTKTTLKLNPVTVYGAVDSYDVQFFGGDIINHSGVDNTGATSELYIAKSNTVSNTNVVYYGGSRLAAEGASNAADTTLTVASGVKNNRVMYGGSDLAAANAKQTGTTTLDILGGYENITSSDWFGGSRMGAAGAEQSGASEIIIEIDGPTVTTNTFGGSNLCTAGTKHSGTSKVTLKGGETYARSNTYGGSKVVTASEHSGDSEIAVVDGYIQGSGVYAFGGSYLSVSGAKHSGASKFTMTAGEIRSSASGVWGGSNIAVDGASQTGTSSMIINGGLVAAVHGAGSYTNATIADTDTTDLIGSGFVQLADVYYEVNGGTVSGNISAAGYKSNVKGSVNVKVTGGTITAQLCSLSGQSANTVSVSGNAVIKIHGGTFTEGIINGGSNNSATAGNNVIGKTYYMEFVNDGKGEDIVFAYAPTSDTDTRTQIYVEPAGRSPITADYANSDCYVRFVGNIPFYSAEGVVLAGWNFVSRLGYMTDRYIDYTQYIGASGTDKLLSVGSFNHIYRHIDGINVVIADFNGNTAELGALSSLAGQRFTWYSSEKTFEELHAFNSFTDYPNNFCIVDAETGEVLNNGIQMNTASIKVQNGAAKSNTIAVTSATIAAAKEAAIAKAKLNYSVVGSSIRLDNLAMRCRAKISQEFFAAHTGEAVTDGVRIARIGMIVGLDNSTPFTLGMEGTQDAWVWADGALNSITGNGKFAEEADYEGYYLYQAAITGYETAGVIDSTHANTTVYFRAYIILEDANGVQEIVYIDSPAEGAGAVNYGKTLVEAATDAKATSWYTNLSDERKSKVDDIINA